MNDHGYRPTVVRLGLPDDKFVEHGSVEELQRIVGLDDEAIARVIAKYQQ
jgi:1-deoxy-D-xylulose-5-phosphate synthase